MTKHIGIVACSAPGAALAYETICAEGSKMMGPHDHPEVSMHNHSLARYVKCIDRNDWEGVADLMLSSAAKLKAAGADFLICPDNTFHQAMPFVEPKSPLPWLHIAKIVAEEARSHGFRKIGLTGTKWLVQSNVYSREFMRPTDAEREECSRIIMDELVYGIFKPEGVACFQGVIDRFKRDGCDAVILGCTEIPLIINDGNSALPTLDSTRLLARAALRNAIA